MKSKKLLYLLCILAFYACKDISSKVERLTLQPSSIIQDSLFTQIPGSLLLCNRYLVWEDSFNPKYFLRIVDINAKKEIGIMGVIGRGPKEFITPQSIKSTGNKVFTFDLNQDKQAYYSIDSLLMGKDPFISHPLHSINNCLNIVQITKNEFISLQPENEYPFQWIHADSSVSFFGKNLIKEKLNDYFTCRQGYLKYNPDKKALIYCANHFPYIALYEKKDSTFLLKWEKTSPKRSYEVENGKIHFLDNQEIPNGMAITKDYIIVLQQDEDAKLPPIKRTGGIRDFSKVPNTIFVYDYEANLKKIIKMDMPILRIEGDNNSNTLYAIGIDLDFCILTYEI